MISVQDAFLLAQIAGRWAAFFVPLALKSSLLLGLLLLVSGLMRHTSASSRHMVWALGLTGLLLLPLLTVGLPSWRAVPLPSIGGAPVNTQENVVLGPTAAAFDAAPDATAQSLAPGATVSRSAPVANPSTGNGSPNAGAAPSLSARVDSPARGDGPLASIVARALALPAAVWCFSIWLSGIVLLCAAFVGGMVRLRHVRAEARRLTGDGWPELLEPLSRELGLTSVPVLLCSPRAVTPMTWGVRRPVVLLPEDCSRWTQGQRREVLLHELAHVRRCDCLTQLVAHLVCVLHWFNPLMWLGARRMRAERERACDDQVLMGGTLPSTYASHLLDIAGRLGAEERALSVGVAMARRSRIFDRLDAVLDPKMRRPAPGRYATTIAVALTLAIVVPLAVLGPTVQAEAQRSESAAVTIISDDGDEPFKVRWDGEIELTSDFKDVEWMSRDSYFRLEQKIDGKWRKLLIEPDQDGTPVYTYTVGRTQQDYNREAVGWLAGVLEEITSDGELQLPRLSYSLSLPALPALPELPELPALPELPEMPLAGSARIRNNDSRTEISWSCEEDGASLKLELEGRIEFNDDDTGIVWMDDDAYFKIEKKEGRKRVTIEAEPDDEGRPVYEYKVGRKTMPFDDKAAQLLAEILQDTMLELGVNAEARVRRTYEQDGTAGVLKLIDRVDSDYSKAKYYSEYFALRDLRDADVENALDRMARDLDSDYELASVLMSYVDTYMASEGTRRSFLKCMSSIDSDYEKARVLKAALEGDDVTHDVLAAVLEAAGDIESDYEAARVLTAIDPELLSNGATCDLFFAAFKRIDSDYEKAGVLISLSRHARRDENLRQVCLEAADNIDSEYEYGKVVRALR